MRNRVDVIKAGLVTLIGAIVITGVHGCKKKEPLKPLEGRLLKDTKIAFGSMGRDGNNEIYVINADGGYQIRLTNNAVSDYAHPADEEQLWSIWEGNARVKR